MSDIKISGKKVATHWVIYADGVDVGSRETEERALARVAQLKVKPCNQSKIYLVAKETYTYFAVSI